jgi:uncharacterized protein
MSDSPTNNIGRINNVINYSITKLLRSFGAGLSGLIVAFVLILCLVIPSTATEWPRPQGPIGDYAKVIPPQYAQGITAASTELWQKTGAALVVATLPSLEGDTIEEAAVHLFQKWGIGEKGVDKGLLFLLAVKERRMRIEVGYGLEGIITDATAGAIRDQAMVPYLKKNEFGKGLYAGVAAAAQIIAKDQGVKLTGVPNVKVQRSVGRLGIIGLFFVFLVIFILLTSLRRGSARGVLPAILLGSILGGGFRGHGGGGGFGGFGGGGFGGFGGGMSGGGGASGGF